MADDTFPDDLYAAQTRLHQALAEYAALCRTLPWSVEPMSGWEGKTHPHTGDVTCGRADSPGYTEQQKTDERRLRDECVELSVLVGTHPYWATVEPGDQVAARQRLKALTKPAAQPA